MFKNKIFRDLISQRNLIVKYDEFNTPIFTPEDDEGYIEYKLRLDHIDNSKFDRLVTQMIYRLNEGKLSTGKYIAYYFLGVDDYGTVGLINQEVLNKTIDVLETIVSKSSAEVHSIECIQINRDRYVAAVHIRKCCNDRYINEYRIAILGASNHGKTTCIGFLTYSEKDNGNGSGRIAIFKHTHEQNTGITSSIKHDILGFKNNVVNNYKSNTFSTWDKIVGGSDGIVSIFDLPGSPKYMRTTIFGISALRVDLHTIVISIADCYYCEKIFIPSGTTSLIEMSIYFNIPIFILFTKLDLVTREQEVALVNYLNNLFKIFNKRLVYYDDLNNCSDGIPYLSVSNVTGKNYDKFIHFLNKVSQIKSNIKNIIPINKGKIDFMIYDVINIREIGYIVSGISISGSIRVGDRLFVGPISGQLYPISIKSVRKKQIESNIIFPGESGSIEIRLKVDGTQTKYNLENIEIEKYMNILDERSSDYLADHIYIKSDMIKNLSAGHQYMMYMDNLIEAVILSGTISNENVGIFKFVRGQKLYVRIGSKCIIKSDPSSDLYIYGTSWVNE